MNNNFTNNMSNYQKLIFVKGIEETNNDNNFNIKELSSNYPFAMFITTNADGPKYDNNKLIHNIWFDGVRLTRFIGVDQTNNIIQIGEHQVRLDFDYDTGLLKIIDNNELLSVKLVGYSYTPVNSSIETTEEYNGETTIEISAKDNKFNLIFEYESKPNSTGKSISNISKKLLLNSSNYNYINEISNNNVNNSTNTLDTITRQKISYNILQSNIDELVNTNNDLFIFTSQYATNVYASVNLKLYLNPISYSINIPALGLYNISDTLISKIFEANKEYHIELNFNNISNNQIIDSSDNLELYVKLTADDPNKLIIIKNYDECEINNGIASFDIETITTLPINVTNLTSKLIFNVYYKKIDTDKIPYNNLQKEINISFDSINFDKLFYFGYEYSNIMDPEINSFIDYVTNLVLSNDYSSINIGNDKLFNYKTYNADNEIGEKYFYYIIPESYENIILPRWDGYIINEYGQKVYCDASTWFDEIWRGEICNIRCIIYKKITYGKFYGYVQ